MLDDTLVVQTNQGSSGASAPVTSFSMTLGTPATADNALFAFTAITDLNRTMTLPAEWIGMGAVDNLSPIPHYNSFVTQAVGGETTIACTIDGVGDIVAWFVLEYSGLATMVSVLDTTGSPTNKPVGEDVGVGASGIATAAATCDTRNNGFVNPSGDDLVLAVGCANKASGTPQLVSTVADTTAGQPGTWARLGSTVATSRVSGSNLRLDVFHKYTGGVQHVLDATFTWATAPAGVCASIDAFRAASVEPQRVDPRQSFNSMM